MEIEFAVRMGNHETPADFGFLQMRPLICPVPPRMPPSDAAAVEDVLCRSTHVLGNGRMEDIHDVVVVDYESFHRASSVEVPKWWRV